MQRKILVPLGAALAVTLIVGVGSRLVPKAHVATFVGLTFLAATWLFVWREADDVVERHGLGMGGALLAADAGMTTVLKRAGVALAWAAGFAVAIFVPYYFGWLLWWRPENGFSIEVHPKDVASDAAGQFLLIALPEEAFYRGFLQSRLDEAWTPKWRVFGATIGPSLLVTSAIFAAGHVITIQSPARLAVFFPALLFGWLRARTGGIGAAVAFHAMCNIYSELLGRGYGAY